MSDDVPPYFGKETSVGYRVSTYSPKQELWFYTDRGTEEEARALFESRNANGKPSKLERITETIEVIGHPTFEPE